MCDCWDKMNAPCYDRWSEIETRAAVDRLIRRAARRRRWRRVRLGLALAMHAMLPGGGAA